MPKLGMGPVRRAQVFRAASEVIARETFSGTTIMKVAQAAGVSTGTVNHYFANKRALLIETLAHLAAEWNSDLRKAVEQAEPGEARLAALVDAAGPTTSINKLRWKVWTAAWSEAVTSRELRTALRHSRERWISLLAEEFETINIELGGPKVDAQAIARKYDALQNGLFIQMLTSDGSVDREIVEILREYLSENLGPRAASQGQAAGDGAAVPVVQAAGEGGVAQSHMPVG
jgi:TetR/AcrR family transcriptional regulator, transcriptional repressor of bet genes